MISGRRRTAKGPTKSTGNVYIMCIYDNNSYIQNEYSCRYVEKATGTSLADDYWQLDGEVKAGQVGLCCLIWDFSFFLLLIVLYFLSQFARSSHSVMQIPQHYIMDCPPKI